MPKKLIAFYSRADENYVNGEIRRLEKGNTEIAVGIIHEFTGADLFKIEQAQAYSKDYNACIVFTFLEHFDFGGKTIRPFCTHEGSGMGSSESDIKRLCPSAEMCDGLAIRGGSVESAKDEIEKWA